MIKKGKIKKQKSEKKEKKKKILEIKFFTKS